MKTITSQWFECKVALDRTLENGLTKKVTEVYVVDALSFTEAEARIIEEVAPFTQGEFNIKGMVPTAYKEVSFMEDANEAAHWYKAKVAFITLDEKTGKEKRSNVLILVQACSLRNATENIDALMKDSMTDHVSVNATETAIIDVFQYKHKD